MTAQASATVGSQADFARANGWEKSYVTKLKQAGRLVMTADGLVDFEASMARIKATSAAPERAAPAVQGVDFARAQDRERFYSAELKRLEYEREVGRLVVRSDVEAVVAGMAAVYRAGIEAMADRLPAQIAALGADEPRIRALLSAEGEQLLRRVADRFSRLQANQGAAA